MPGCDEGLGFYRAHFRPHRQRRRHLPIGDYNSSGRLHTNEHGTAALSQRIADQLAAAISSPAYHTTTRRHVAAHALLLQRLHLLFPPVALIGYQILGRFGRRAVFGWLSLVSLFFYGYWNPKYLFLLGGSILLNFIGSRVIARVTTERARPSHSSLPSPPISSCSSGSSTSSLFCTSSTASAGSRATSAASSYRSASPSSPSRRSPTSSTSARVKPNRKACSPTSSSSPSSRISSPAPSFITRR